jgi:Sigma-70 region 2
MEHDIPRGALMAPEADDPNSSMSLLRRAREGDAAALNELLARYLPRLERWASRRLPPALRTLLNTDDLVQDATIKAIAGIGQIEIRCAVGTFVGPPHGLVGSFGLSIKFNRDQTPGVLVRYPPPKPSEPPKQ